jgi:hypothetical protein
VVGVEKQNKFFLQIVLYKNSTKENLFHRESQMKGKTRQLYASILREIGPTPLSPPSPAPHTMHFEDMLLQTVKLVNRQHSWEYITLLYEGNCSWTIMGHHPSDWMQFDYVDANRFRITRLIPGQPGCLCSLRSGGIDMYNYIRDALRFYGRDPEADPLLSAPMHCTSSSADPLLSSPTTGLVTPARVCNHCENDLVDLAHGGGMLSHLGHSPRLEVPNDACVKPVPHLLENERERRGEGVLLCALHHSFHFFPGASRSSQSIIADLFVYGLAQSPHATSPSGFGSGPARGRRRPRSP